MCFPALSVCSQIGVNSSAHRVSCSVPSASWFLSLNGTSATLIWRVIGNVWWTKHGILVSSSAISSQWHQWVILNQVRSWADAFWWWYLHHMRLPATANPVAAAGWLYMWSLKKLNSFALLPKPLHNCSGLVEQCSVVLCSGSAPPRHNTINRENKISVNVLHEFSKYPFTHGRGVSLSSEKPNRCVYMLGAIRDCSQIACLPAWL